MDVFEEGISTKLVLGEHGITEDFKPKPYKSRGIKRFKKHFRVNIIRSNNDNELEFDLIGISAALANAFRRLMISDVPSMAIEKVIIANNTSIIQDEVLAHRLGLVPLKADARLFEMRQESNQETESNENECLEFSLKIRCSANRDTNKDASSRAEDLYKNSNVYSEHIKWQPIGGQKDRSCFTEKTVGPIHDDILIAKMRPGHELDVKLVAVKGIGRDHAKFSPVCTAFYRLLPEIKLLRPVEGEQAVKLQACFTPGVIDVVDDPKNGRKTAVVRDSRKDMCSRNVFRHEDLKNAVEITKVEDHFIFTVESVGALAPNIIFTEAVKILRQKCIDLLDELKQ